MKTKELKLSTKQHKTRPAPKVAPEEESPATKSQQRRVLGGAAAIVVNLSAKTATRQRRRYISLGISLLLILMLGVLATHFIARPAVTIKNALDQISATTVQLGQDLANRDLSMLNQRFSDISEELAIINKQIDEYDFLQRLSFTEGYYRNLQLIKGIIARVERLMTDLLPELTPILSAAGYKTQDQSGQIINPDPASEIKISAFLKQAPDLLLLYEKLEPQVIQLTAEVNKLDPNYIPTIGESDLVGNLSRAQKLLGNFPEFSTEFKRSFRVLPELLGVGKSANYLVLFQNEKELRPSGGLITAYGNMAMTDGELSDQITAKDMWNLHNDLLAYGVYPKIYNKNGQLFLMTHNSRCGASITRPQDSGVYPDQYQDITTFIKYYDAAAKVRALAKDYPSYDHVVMLNTLFAESLISFVDPVPVPEFNMTVDAGNMSLTLTNYFNTTAAFGKVETEKRKDFIKYLATAVKNKFNELPASEFPAIVKDLLQNVQARHISFYSKNSDVQAYFDEMSLSGRVATPDKFSGDYLLHSEGQYCALKSNFYVQNDVNVEVDIGSDKRITNNVRVEWRNEAISIVDGKEVIPGYIINPTGQFPYAAWTRLLVPPGSKLITTDGYKQSGTFAYQPKQYLDKELASYVLESVLQFRHVRKEKDDVKRKAITTKYRLPDNLKYDETTGYSVLLIKHAGKAAEKYIYTVKQNDARSSQEFRLERDKVLKWQNGEFTLLNYDDRLDGFIALVDTLQNFFEHEK